MSAPITKNFTDNSGDEFFNFSFFCDCCGKEWKSQPVPFKKENLDAVAHEQEHKAAFEQANLDAHVHFNFCPLCERWVCDDCISLNEKNGEVCKECDKQANTAP